MPLHRAHRASGQCQWQFHSKQQHDYLSCYLCSIQTSHALPTTYHETSLKIMSFHFRTLRWNRLCIVDVHVFFVGLFQLLQFDLMAAVRAISSALPKPYTMSCSIEVLQTCLPSWVRFFPCEACLLLLMSLLIVTAMWLKLWTSLLIASWFALTRAVRHCIP